VKRRVLPRGVYATEVVALYGTRAEINRYFKRRHSIDEKIEKGVCGQHSMWVPDDPKQYTRRYICIVRDCMTSKAERWHTLVHEAVHCALSIFDDKGVKYSGDNDEQLAYFVEWLCRECEKVFA
jgi:hypothetical protein